MLRRKATKIEVKIDDREELEEARKRAAASTNTSTSSSTATAASSLLRHFDRSSQDPTSKSQRIGLSP